MSDFENSLAFQRGEFFTTPLMPEEHPFWVCACGHTYKNKPFHEITTKTNIARIEYIISGECVLNTKNLSCIASAGDTYWLHQGDDHNYYPASTSIVEKLWINIKGELITELENFFNLKDVVLFKNIDCSKYLNKIHTVCKNTEDPYEIQEQASAVFLNLVHFLSKKYIASQADVSYIDAIRSYIDLHIHEKITIDDLTRISYTTPEHTINTFKEKFGVTPHQYIMQGKIQLAKTLLYTAGMSVEEISDMLNFSNIGHFSNTFYKFTGLRPSQYKKITKDY